jgi:diguanylate cyclase (GGDEF)-like protein
MNDERTRASEGRSLFSVSQIQHMLRVEFGRAQRYRYPLSVVVVAIDQLGAVRDRRGFEAKESVVEKVVRLLSEVTRTSDYLGRTPDDRLLAVVPHTDEAGLRSLTQRLLAGARLLDVNESGGESGGERLTLSIGATSTSSGDPLFHDVLMVAAETAQSEAAAAGGDSSVIRPPTAAGA